MRSNESNYAKVVVPLANVTSSIAARPARATRRTYGDPPIFRALLLLRAVEDLHHHRQYRSQA